ncbi:MAG: hypothetical protein JOS17DRAFT_769925 [Linnemannia elongata]|nr:MAG: hypothetical protein JOS17DRAFT_769925 [Linnemannia elongata]
MVILQWFTRRACTSIIAAHFITQWILISRCLPFFANTNDNTSGDTDEPKPLTTQLRQQVQQWTEGRGRDLASVATWTNNRWTRFKEHAVNKILYQDDDGSLHNESGDNNGDDIEQMDGSEALRIPLDAEEVGEMDDGEEDPTYFPGETKFLFDMPDWIPDWLTSETIHPSALWPPQQPIATTSTDTETQNEVNNIIKRDDDNDNDLVEHQRERKQDQDQERQKRPPILDVVYTWVNGSDPE